MHNVVLVPAGVGKPRRRRVVADELLQFAASRA
jgi:hypothetical protein